ncbi:MAG TPA: hypothetical protein VGE98_00390 [Thermoanaerobaculia bacterium]
MNTESGDRPEAPEIPAALACRLPEGEAGRRRALVGALFEQALARRATDDGVELEYAGDDETARGLLDFVLFERRCCAEVAYHLSFAPDHSRVRLRLAGDGPLAAAVRQWAGL